MTSFLYASLQESNTTDELAFKKLRCFIKHLTVLNAKAQYQVPNK